jgi:hypothetical protein
MKTEEEIRKEINRLRLTKEMYINKETKFSIEEGIIRLQWVIGDYSA